MATSAHIMNSSPDFHHRQLKRLPVELWHHILQPEDNLDISLEPTAHVEWAWRVEKVRSNLTPRTLSKKVDLDLILMRRNAMLVCRAWHGIALGSLYSHVCVGPSFWTQSKSFEDTFPHKEHLKHTKCLTILPRLAGGPLMQAQERLVTLVAAAPNMRILSCSVDRLCVLLNAKALPAKLEIIDTESILEETWLDTDAVMKPSDLPRQWTLLRFLSISSASRAWGYGAKNRGYESFEVVFPHLECLVVNEIGSYYLTLSADYIIRKWTAPIMKTLVIGSNSKAWNPFLIKHGKNLETLVCTQDLDLTDLMAPNLASLVVHWTPSRLAVNQYPTTELVSILHNALDQFIVFSKLKLLQLAVGENYIQVVESEREVQRQIERGAALGCDVDIV